MQAILTKYTGPTNVKGSRIIAKCDAMRIVVGFDYALDIEGNHVAAAAELCRRMDALCVKKYGSAPNGTWTTPRIAGQLPDRSYAHVFAPQE